MAPLRPCTSAGPGLSEPDLGTCATENTHKRLKKKGVYIGTDYVNLHLLPLFKHQIAYGKNNFPWSISNKNYIYKKGDCPVAENYKTDKFICISMCDYEYSKKNIKFITSLFKEFWKRKSS